MAMGIVQGLTEFLPISSSGHLVLTEHLFGSGQSDLFFDTVLHLGTLAAVLVVFGSDVWDMIVHVLRGIGKIRNPHSLAKLFDQDASFRLALLIVVGTVPAVVAGLAFESTFERLFDSVRAVGVALCITGAVLLSTRLAPAPGKDTRRTTLADALIIGLAQAAAITPGISRSGLTISAALFRKMDRELAGRFSFLLAIPAIIGAVALQFRLPGQWPPGYLPALAIGFVASALVGYAALKLLIGLVKRGKFFYFGLYCLPVGAVVIIASYF